MPSCNSIADKLDRLICKLNFLIVNPLIFLLGAAAFAYFLWGLVSFLSNSDNEEEKSKGKRHMLWGLLGLAIIIAVFGLMQLILDTIGATGIDPKGGGVDLPDF